MLRKSRFNLHGLLRLHVGSSTVPVDGIRVVPMEPCNPHFQNGPKLRQILDEDGFLYFKGLVPRDAMRLAYGDVCKQLDKNKWWCEETEKRIAKRDGFFFGAASPPSFLEDGITPAPPLPTPSSAEEGFHISERIQKACFGPSVLAAIRQIFGGGAEMLNYNSLDLSQSGERHGFYMPSVYMNQGTKLVLTVWIAMHDMPLSVGGICCVKGSNSCDEFKKVRETYGQHEVETGNICGDGTLTTDPDDVWNLSEGACPLATASFEPGDCVISTVYTMQSFSTNISHQWRCSCQSRWVMHGDDVGADPRFSSGSTYRAASDTETETTNSSSSSSSSDEEQEEGKTTRRKEQTDEYGNAVQLANWIAHRDDINRYPRTMAEARKDWGIAPMFPPS